MCLVATILVLFVGLKCPSEFSEPKWVCQFGYIMCEESTDTVGCTCGTGLGQDDFGGQLPRPPPWPRVWQNRERRNP